ncbi:hypothetical protein GCM10022243_48440 [Saccharothrix violaceirubra]|uniref:Uncharacterized protein n=1 Tax=Saccharothrix violaceirubra TaxID=413306 RepID=A0A7W7WU40_9PSEU|nr:hypothetical protein [Saccharothrix violaceirubra]MBB4963814.1 hypothetical protein [Saccharothrix violaceirubra]
MADTRLLRTCIGCAQTDDHPRHVVWQPGDVEVTWHMDCHVIATGCPVCEGQLAGADGLTGDALRAHLTTKDG